MHISYIGVNNNTLSVGARHICIVHTIRGVAEGGPDRAQAHPNVACALPTKIEKDRNTLIEHSNTLLMQSLTLVVPCHPCETLINGLECGMWNVTDSSIILCHTTT